MEEKREEGTDKVEETVQAPVEEELQVERQPQVQEAKVDTKPEPLKKNPELPNKLLSQVKKIGDPAPKVSKIKEFIAECKRVLRVTKKPDKQEFQTIVKVSALGMAVIGVLGFLIHLVKEWFF